MKPQTKTPWKQASALLAAALLSACGGGSDTLPRPSRVELLRSDERGMQSVALDAKNAYLSLHSSATQPSSVLSSGLNELKPASTWAAVNLGACALPVSTGPGTAPAGRLNPSGGKIHLLQNPQPTGKEHSWCELDAAGSAFTPKDAGLKVCANGQCETLWANQLKAVGNRLFSNAGAGVNLLVSDNGGGSWRALLGAVDSMICTHQSFEVIGNRVLVGGECPLDMAYVRAYGLTADGGQLSSTSPLPLQLPELENRNVHFIQAVAGTDTVYIGIEGGLLRSEDKGQSFKFVLKHALSDSKSYPYITQLLTLPGKPRTVVAAGFDKASGKPFLSWSANGGEQWSDLSALLPGYQRPAGSAGVAEVSSLALDAQGQVLLTVNEESGKKGRLLRLTLGDY